MNDPITIATTTTTTAMTNDSVSPSSNDNDHGDHSERDGILRDQPIGSVAPPPTSSSSSASWSCGSSFCLKVLTVTTMILTIDVILLMIFIMVKEPLSSSSSSSSTSSTNTTRWNLTWLELPSKSQVLTTIAFGSCSNQIMPQPYWDTLVQYIKPDILLLMGDNVYGDCKSIECIELQDAYNEFAIHPSLKGAISSIPIIATLDDHDYGYDNSWNNNPYKDIAKELFLDFFNIHDERRTRRTIRTTTNNITYGEEEGVYQEFTFGPIGQQVQIIMLDTRYNRSEFISTNIQHKPYTPDYNDTTKQILSPQQWKWLENAIQRKNKTISSSSSSPSSSPQVRLIVSSIQVLNTGTGFECWNMLPYELERLQRLLLDHDNNNETVTILLSGDRHVGGFYESSLPISKLTSSSNSTSSSINKIYEVTSSSWTHTIPFGAYGSDCTNSETCDEIDSNRIGNLIRDNHFGTIEINWIEKFVTVALRRAEATPYYTYSKEGNHHHTTDAGSIIQSQTYKIP